MWKEELVPGHAGCMMPGLFGRRANMSVELRRLGESFGVRLEGLLQTGLFRLVFKIFE